MPDPSSALPAVDADASFWSAMDALRVGVTVQGPSSEVLYFNSTACQLLGVTPDQLTQRTSFDPAWRTITPDGQPLPPEQRPGLVALRTGEPVEGFTIGVHRPTTNDFVWLIVNAIPQKDAAGNVTRVIATFRDVTALKASKRAHAAALAEADRFRSALDMVPAYVYIKDRDSRYVYANAQTLQLFGVSAAELPGSPDARFFPPETVPRLRAIDVRVLAGESTREYVEVPNATGTRTYLEVKSPLIGPSGSAQAEGIVGISVDITEQREAEARANRISAFYAALAYANDAIARELDEPALFAEICRLAVEVGGVSMAWIGLVDQAAQRVTPVASFGDRDGYVSALDISLVADDPTSQGLVGRAVHRGDAEWVADVATDTGMAPWHEAIARRGWRAAGVVPLHRAGAVVGVLTLYADAPETFDESSRRLLGDLAASISVALDRLATRAVHDAAEEALRQSRDRFQQLFDGMVSGLLVVDVLYDADGAPAGHRYVGVNRAFTELTGLNAENVVGRTDKEFTFAWPAELVQRFYGVAKGGAAFEYERHNEQLDRIYETRVFSPVRGQFAHSFTEVTARRALEAQMRQAQRMESVGRLAGGVAHDFNNMLGVILGRTELALLDAEVGSRLHEDLTEILVAGRRSAELTRQLLAFARKQTLTPKVLDVSDAVRRSVSLIRGVVGEDIALHQQYADALWPVLMDPGQLDHILANLCLNARDAIRVARRDPAHDSAADQLVITTRNVTLDAAFVARHPDAAIGEFVQLSVRDTGCGIAPELFDRIFEPFFTTKGVGEGTGLGLAMVLGTVQQSGGFITVSSTPAQGSTFDLYLPRRTDPLSPPGEAAPPIVGGAETILIAEDEAALLELARQSLSRLGYRVLSANGPQEALAIAVAHEGNIDLLLTDVVMPKMNGGELAQQLRASRPTLRVLFMSGYSADVLHEDMLRDGRTQFLAKPFSLSELTSKVRQVLQRA